MKCSLPLGLIILCAAASSVAAREAPATARSASSAPGALTAGAEMMKKPLAERNVRRMVGALISALFVFALAVGASGCGAQGGASDGTPYPPGFESAGCVRDAPDDYSETSTAGFCFPALPDAWVCATSVAAPGNCGEGRFTVGGPAQPYCCPAE